MKLNKIFKNVVIFYALMHIFSLYIQFNASKLYLEGNVTLSINDTKNHPFYLKTSFEHSEISFYPKHYFTMLLNWQEVRNETYLLLYLFFNNLPTLLALLFCSFLIMLYFKEKLQLIYESKYLKISVLLVFVLEKVCFLIAEYYKVQFFQRSLFLENANWYIHNDILNGRFHLGSLIGTLTGIFICALFYQNLVQKAKEKTT